MRINICGPVVAMKSTVLLPMMMMMMMMMMMTVVSGDQLLAEDAGVVLREFLYQTASFPACHASTIEETPEGLVAAYFGGTYEKHPDVGIWVQRLEGDQWTEPVEVADGVQYTLTDGTQHRHPTWNPVLFQYPGGPLTLFYKVGPSPDTWWGMLTVSRDHGKTWSTPVRLPEHIDGPVRNKPLLLENGSLLCGSSTEFDGWRVHFEMTSNRATTWQRTPAIHDGRQIGAIQPTLLRHRDGSIQALCRNQNGNGKVLSTVSRDEGKTWSELKEISLPNPNSGIDAVTLQDGRFLLVYNHTVRAGESPRGREMLNIAVSSDGENWKAAVLLENVPKGEFSYPAVIQTADGKVHTTYTWQRQRVTRVVVDPDALSLRDFRDGQWPLSNSGK